ncbi:PilZ domain-containing protein [Desulfolithobacter sp.]
MTDTTRLIQILSDYFPQKKFTGKTVATGIEDGKIIVDPVSLANHLGSGLHDESLLEVELGGLTRLFFCRILDHPPETEIPGEEDENPMESDYTKGDYLKTKDHVIITPLEPAIGNYLVCSIPRMVLRILTSRMAIELCLSFEKKTLVQGLPALKCSFPIVARLVEGAREYRAKIPRNMLFDVRVTRKRNNQTFTTRPMDMSVSGMCLYDPAGRKTSLRQDERVHLNVLANGETILDLDGTIRHVTRLRDAKGLQYVFGVQFDLVSRAISTDVEKLVAGIQRARLRELSQLADEFGVDFGKW